jgi:PAS domain S-box-containing protein
MENSPNKNNAFLQQIADSTPDLILFVLDKNLNYIFFNKKHFTQMKNIWGGNIKIGDSILNYINKKEEREKAVELFNKVLQGEALHFEDKKINRDGKPTWYEVQLTPVRNEKDKIYAIAAAIRDITKRKEREKEFEELNKKLKMLLEAREEKLSESENKFQILVDLLPEGVVVHNMQGILYANKTAGKLFRVKDLNNLTKKSVFDFLHPDFKTRALERVNAALKEGKSFLPPTKELLIRCDGTAFWGEVSGFKKK